MKRQAYELNGKTYKVPNNEKGAEWLRNNPTAVLLGDLADDGKTVIPKTDPPKKEKDPTTTSQSTGSSNQQRQTEANRIMSGLESSSEDGSLDYVEKATTRFDSYQANNDQVLEAEKRAKEEVDTLEYLANTDFRQIAREEEQGENFWEGVLTTVAATASLQTEPNKRASDALEKKKGAKKELNELYNAAFDSLLEKENKKRDRDQQIVKVDDNGDLTQDYNAWLVSIKGSDLLKQEAIAVRKQQYVEDYFEENIEKSIEDRTSWYELGRTEGQLEEEDVAVKAIEQLNEETKKVVTTQNALVKGMGALGEKSKMYEELSSDLSVIGKKLEAINSKTYNTQEEYDAASVEFEKLKQAYDNRLAKYNQEGGLSYDQIIAEQEAYSKAYVKLQEKSEDIIKDEEDLRKYADAVGRNYNFITNVYGQMLNGATQLAANYSSFVGMVDDMIESAASNLPEGLQESGANMMRMYAGPLSATLLANRAAEGVVDTNFLEETEKALYGYSESISNYLEAPPEFSEIKDFKSAGEWYANMVASQAANTAVTVSTGGASLFVLGMTSAGAKYHDLEEEMKSYAELPDGDPMKDFKYSKAQQYASAIFSGAVEGLSEKITLGQLNKVKGLISTNNIMQRGFNNFLYRNFATKRGLYNNFYDPVEEGLSESISQFGSNVVDRFILGKENSLLEGMDESFVSGVLMSGTVFKAPAIGKNVIKAFQSTDVTAEVEQISRDLQEKQQLLDDYMLSDEVKADVEAEMDSLVKRHTLLMQETISGYQNLTVKQRNALINIDINKARLLKANKNIDDQNILTTPAKPGKQISIDASTSFNTLATSRAKNNASIAELNAVKQQILSQAAGQRNLSKVQRRTAKVQRDIEKITGKPAKVVRANSENINESIEEFRKSEVEFYDNEISKRKGKLEEASGAKKVVIEKQIKDLETEKLAIQNKDFSDALDSDGFIGGGGTILVNEDVAVSTGATNVANHEFLHNVLKNTLADNPAAAVAMGEAIGSYLDKLDPDTMEQSVLADRIRLYKDNPLEVRSEEMLTLFLDAIATGDIKINTSSVGKLKSAFSDIISSAGLNKKNIKLNTAQDVVDFIANFQDSRDSIFGFRRRATAKRAMQGIELSEELLMRGSLAKMEDSRSRGLRQYGGKQTAIKKSASSDVTAAIDELGSMGWDNNTWKEGGGTFALETMVKEKMLDRLIASKLKVPMPPSDTAEFVAKVYAELTNHVNNFKPESNDSLFGWINSQISNKAGNVYNREYKATEETRGVDIDATTSEGNPVIQIADDVDYEMARIDDIGLNEVEKEEYSKLRRDLKLDDAMMDRVRETVMKTFGTKLPEVDSKKFKEALEKAFRTELKKPIQDMMGGRSDYDFFLIDNFRAVFKALPVSTLVQMERNLDPDKRIFTTSERITKPTEVDRLVSEGRLPKDVNRLSGPQLHTKKPMPTTEQVLAFFRGKNMEGVLGYKVGGSTLGTRKDKLAMEIGVELAFDATLETVQRQDVQDRRKGILEIQGFELLDNDVAMIAKAIDRDPAIKFSTSRRSAKKLFFSTGIAKENRDLYLGGAEVVLEQMKSNEHNLVDKKAVLAILKDVYGNDISSGELSGVADSIVKFAKEYQKLKDKNLDKAPGDIKDFILAKIDEKGYSDKLRDFFGTGADMTALFRDEKNKVKLRGAVKDMFSKLEAEFGRAIAIEIITDLESSIGKDSGSHSYAVYNSKDGATSSIYEELGITESEVESGKASRTGDVISETFKVVRGGDISKTKTRVDRNRRAAIAATEYFAREFQNGSTVVDNVVIAMAMQAMNNSTDNAFRDASMPAFVAKGVVFDKKKGKHFYKNSEGKLEDLTYEHMVPVKNKIMEVLDQALNNKGNKVNENVFDNFEVAIIPESMDKAVSDAGLRSSMPTTFKVNDSGIVRYYNTYTLGNKDVARLVSISTGKEHPRSKEFNRANKTVIKGKVTTKAGEKALAKVSIRFSESPKGMSAFDFDETLIIHGENFIVATQPGVQQSKLYNASPKSFNELGSRTGLIFLATERREADAYADMNSGDVREIFVDNSKVGTEEQLLSKIEELGYSTEDALAYELIDTRFDNSLKQSEIQEVLNSLKKDGILGIKYNDGSQVTGKGTKSVVVFDKSIISEQPIGSIKISSGDWPIKGPQLAADGYEFDFSDFVNVRGGVEGPLLQKMKNQIEKFGSDNVFVLTARPSEAATPIHEWLKSKGINIPLENVTGLGDGRGEAKAAWIIDKYQEGYNDMYFVDDALPNVKAVKEAMDAFDIKGKSVQAMIKFSQSASNTFNDMLERKSGIEAGKVISGSEAKIAGRKKGRYEFFVPPSAEDFKGLIYKFLGKGKQGDADLKFFEKALFEPFSKAITHTDSIRQNMSEDYKALRKEYGDVTSRFKEEIPNSGGLTVEHAIRIFLWQKADMSIPGLSPKQASAVKSFMLEESNMAVMVFAESLSLVTRLSDGYVKPKNYWTAQDIGFDLMEAAKNHRKAALKNWVKQKDNIFSEKNINKIEAIYGSNFRNALEDVLWRMENGTNRPSGTNAVVNKMMNWVNGSVGAVMFFNMRSAVLQTMSAVNYINWNDNNFFKASAAFANQKQYWGDFIELFNSDMLKQRRSGLKIDVSASELASTFEKSGSKAEAIIAYLLEIGFKPTQLADSFAIAAGGATMYRNRINTYKKKGMSDEDAKKQAFIDFQLITEENQQSSRPDFISPQQASPLGRLILAWQNTPMQYTRLTKKALSDLVNNRGDWKENVSKVVYYGFAQNVIFGAIQSGLMFMLFGGDPEEEELEKKNLRVANGTLDTLLRGTGVYGAAAATLKNVIMRWYEESNKDFGKKDLSKIAVEAVNLSPPIGSKIRKIMNAVKSYEYNKDVMKKMDYSFNNPGWDVVANVIEATTNVPLARVVNKAKNVELALASTTEAWQSVALLLGWSKWDVGVEDVELEEAKKEVKGDKAEAAKERAKARREEKKEEKEKEKEKEKEEKEERGIKEVQCSHVKSNGERCGMMVETDKETALCQYHRNYNERQGSDLDNDGKKEFRCTATTSSGKRCRNRTENANKKCYAHQ